jgi:hypothetical protein
MTQKIPKNLPKKIIHAFRKSILQVSQNSQKKKKIPKNLQKKSHAFRKSILQVAQNSQIK